MRTRFRAASPLPWSRLALAALLLPLLALAAPSSAGKGQKEGPAAGSARPAGGTGALEVRFIDDSRLKLVLEEERLELTTPYGKLYVPFADVQRIDFATRIPADDAQRAEAAVAGLGNAAFSDREAAAVALRKLGARAYPALLEAAHSKDTEVARRAEELLEELRTSVPEDLLEVRPHDVIITEQSKIAGHIEGTGWKATTFQFGEVRVKLADLRELHAPGAGGEGEVSGVLPDPGNLVGLQGHVGKRFAFRVTGALAGSVYGTGTYTSDSTLATAAVHMGVLKVGQTGTVRVKIVPSPATFQGSTRNGVTSATYGPYSGAYQILR